LGHLLRFSQVVRPVQQVKVNSLDAQPPKRLLAGVDEMWRGEIVAPRRVGLRVASGPDAAFGHEHDPVAHAGYFLEHVAEYALSLPAAVDVRVIEQGVTRFICREDRLPPGRAA